MSRRCWACAIQKNAAKGHDGQFDLVSERELIAMIRNVRKKNKESTLLYVQLSWRVGVAIGDGMFVAWSYQRPEEDLHSEEGGRRLGRGAATSTRKGLRKRKREWLSDPLNAEKREGNWFLRRISIAEKDRLLFFSVSYSTDTSSGNER